MKNILLTIAILLVSCGYNKHSGDQGIPGPVGPAGKDGTNITIVQLCPGTTTYPNNFVEIAFCMNNKLYGTYSANGGFSTEFVPGTYNSNAIGNSCTLTIHPNCEVTN